MIRTAASAPVAEGGTSTAAVVDVSGMLATMSASPAARPQHESPATSAAVVGPGAELAGLLEQARRLQRVTAMLAAAQASLWSRVLAHATESESSVTRSSSSSVELAVRSVAAEFGAALNLSDLQVQRQLSDAYTLVTLFPATHAALDGGLITPAHAQVIVRAGAGITDGAARSAYEVEAVAKAHTTTPWRLKNTLAVVAEHVMPVTLDDRHREARKARSITLTDDSDGMSNLSVFLPTLLAHGAYDRIMGMARAIKHDPDDAPVSDAHACADGDAPARSAGGTRAGIPTDASDGGAGDARTLQQIAADVVGDLLLGAAPTTTSEAVAAIRGRVQVTVPVTTLAGLDDTGAVLAGVGPVDAESVRTLAAHQPGWDRIMTDAATGDIVAVDRYTPSTGMRRFLAARDEHCRFPGCRRPVHQCDLDHTQAWEDGGETCIDNLAHLCRRHHVLKHNSAWLVENLGGGVLRWTSPLDYQYIDTPPHRTVTFTTDPPDELLSVTAHARTDNANTPPTTSNTYRPPDGPPPF